MKGDFHPVDDLIRAAVGDPTPDDHDVIVGRRMLLAAMRAEAARPSTSLRPSRLSRATAAAAGALVLVAAIAFGSVIVAPRPVTAQADLAILAELTPTPIVAAEGYVYTKTIHNDINYLPGSLIGLPATGTVAYRLPIVRERWVGSDGGHEGSVERTRTGTPTFFTPEARRAYQSGDFLVFEGVGESTTESYDVYTSRLDERAWSTDPDVLVDQLRAAASNQAYPGDVAVADLVLELVADPLISPDLRAASLLALGQVEIAETSRATDGSTTVQVEYENGSVSKRIVAVFSADGSLVSRSTVYVDPYPAADLPAGTVETEARYVEHARVREIPTF